MTENKLLPYVFKGMGGDSLCTFQGNIWGMTRIGDEIYTTPYYNPDKIYVTKFGTFELVRTIKLEKPLWSYGGLGTDGEKLYARFDGEGIYIIREIDKNNGMIKGDLIQPKTSISGSIGSFVVNKDWNMILMPNYDGNIYAFDLTSGNQIGFNNSGLNSNTCGIAITNKEYIVVGSYSSNSIHVAKINDYATFTEKDFNALHFTSVDVSGGYVSGICSYGNILLYQIYDTGDLKWLNINRLRMGDSHPERYLVLHDSKYKTFNPLRKVKSLTNLVPVLTSNTSNGVASASSKYNDTFDAFRAFDGNGNTAWTTLSNSTYCWLAYEFTSPTLVNAYSIEANETTIGESPRSWHFEGFDGLKWIQLDRRLNETMWTKGEIRAFTFANTTAYIKYRIVCHSNWNKSASYLTIANLNFYNITDGQGGWMDYSTTIPSSINDVFIDGIKDLSIIRESDWNYLSNKDPRIKIIRYNDDTLSDLAKNKVNVIAVKNGYKNTFNMRFTPVNQVAIPLDNISINEDIEKFDLGIDREYHDRIRMFVSFNNGISWESFKFGEWRNVDTQDENDVMINGMRVWEFESLRTKDFKNKISFGYVKVGFMIETDVLEKGGVKVDDITAYINTYMNGADIGKMSLYILNTTAAINITFVGNKLSGTLSDFDLGLVQYRVSLNGKPYYPINGEFTPLNYSPEPINLNIRNQDVLMNQINSLSVDFKDYWGNVDTWTTHFIGTYAGLMFADPSGKYYTTDIGEILQKLNLGTLTAGQTTQENKIQLINQYGNNVKDLEIKAVNEKLPDGIRVELSKTQYPFLPSDKITWNNNLAYGDRVLFFMRLTTDIEANSVPNGTFEIRAKATKV
ncbi:discoidin domain-containing protein [Brevibacillus laterosporus]|uniref:discoidin domain-containing protein n=1 Tax=Brevibacillus laterosporus TaxID=1465 RepID=UPI003D199018